MHLIPIPTLFEGDDSFRKNSPAMPGDLSPMKKKLEMPL
jgi:hypothetical protein